MPYDIKKQDCKQSDGDSGSYVLSYTDKKGKKHNNCHTSKKKAQGQIAAIEGPREMDETDDMVFGGGGFAADDEGEDDEGLEEALLREWIRESLVKKQAEHRMLAEWIYLITEQAAAAECDLVAAVETALADNVDLGYEVEEKKAGKLYYVRFSSSSTRDAMIPQLTQAIKDSLGIVDQAQSPAEPIDPQNPPGPCPAAKTSTVALSAHTRDVMEITDGTTKIRIAFKGPSAGGDGLEFEDVLFAWIKDAIPASPIPDGIGRLRKTFFEKDTAGILTDQEAWEEIQYFLQNPEQTKKSVAALIAQAEDAYVAIVGAQGLGPPQDVETAGGRGIKGDLLLKYPNNRDVDLSLKAEKKTGTNTFIFNKDVGDGTNMKEFGAKKMMDRFPANLVLNPAGVPWWQTARKRMIDGLDSKYKLTAEQVKAWKKKKDPTTEEEEAYAAKLTPENQLAFSADANGGGQENLLKVKNAIEADPASMKGRSYIKSAEVQNEALTVMEAELKKLRDGPDGKRKIISLLEESKFGSSAVNDLYKLTSSGQRSKVSQEVTDFASLFTGNPPKITDATLEDVEITIEKPGKTLTITIEHNKKKLASLEIRGVKFRSSIWSTQAGALSLKTRA